MKLIYYPDLILVLKGKDVSTINLVMGLIMVHENWEFPDKCSICDRSPEARYLIPGINYLTWYSDKGPKAEKRFSVCCFCVPTQTLSEIDKQTIVERLTNE